MYIEIHFYVFNVLVCNQSIVLIKSSAHLIYTSKLESC